MNYSDPSIPDGFLSSTQMAKSLTFPDANVSECTRTSYFMRTVLQIFEKPRIEMLTSCNRSYSKNRYPFPWQSGICYVRSAMICGNPAVIETLKLKSGQRQFCAFELLWVQNCLVKQALCPRGPLHVTGCLGDICWCQLHHQWSSRFPAFRFSSTFTYIKHRDIMTWKHFHRYSFVWFLFL